MRKIKVALLGAGSVGSQTANLILTRGDELAQRVGAPVELVGIAVRDLAAKRDVELPADLFTTDAYALMDRADVVIELVGGIHPAKEYVEYALSRGKDVVTGNKALLAAHQREIFEVGKRGHAETYYEAAVAAAIPIIRPLQDSLIGDRIHRVMGIVNGSTNYILDQIDTRGITMEQALAEAKDLGYLEADPSADVEGWDAASKATILAGLAFHSAVAFDDVHCEGITGVTLEQIQDAKRAGYVVKLLATCERLVDEDGAESVSVRVNPVMIPRQHPLAAVRGGKNAVFIEAQAAGDLMFYGAGAGGVETSSAILGDLVLAAKRILTDAPPQYIEFDANLPIAPLDRVVSRYQVTLTVKDQQGVLAEVAGVFARHGVSVRTVNQHAREVGADTDGSQTASLVVVTHRATEAALQATVRDLAACDVVEGVVGILRVEGA